MAKPLTASSVNNAFNRLSRAVSEWEKADGPYVRWGSSTNVKAFTSNLEVAFEKFLDDTADEESEPMTDAKLLLLRIDDLFDEYCKFKRGIAEEAPSCSPGGSDGLWRAYKTIQVAIAQKPNYSKPLPIAEMQRQSVSLSQIATIYGWLTDDGSPDCLKVSEEIEKPGTHYHPDKWVHPALAKRMAMIEAEWANRLNEDGSPRKRKALFGVSPSAGEGSKSAWVPPSLESMVQEGAPPEQIATVHKITVDEADQMLRDAGTHPDLKHDNNAASMLAGV